MLDFLPDKFVIGMIHLLPLPGAPRYGGDLSTVFSGALADASAWHQAGVDALLVENHGDVPFGKSPVPPVTVAAMTLAVAAIRDVTKLPVGVNVLRNDALAALEIAVATGAQLIRVNVLSGSMLTDQGLVEGDAYRLLRRRRELSAKVSICADVLVKHALSLAPTALERAAIDTARRGLADALIVSGVATGEPTSEQELERVRLAVPDLPLLVGSGVTPENVATLLRTADGVIAGTALKRDGVTSNPVDPLRARQLVRAVATLRRPR